MIRYCLGFAHWESSVVLILKNTPDWQKGLLNGVGGRVELGEAPGEAMVREFKEETSVSTLRSEWNFFHKMSNPAIEVYCFSMNLSQFQRSEIKTTEDKGEEIFVYHRMYLPKNLIHNLSWLIPLSLDTKTKFSESVL